jgi:hypothetical protein
MSSEYKRLGWVQAYASQGTGLAANIYSQARTMVPGFAETFVLQLEETAINIAVPYVTVAQDSAVKVLSSVDAQVKSAPAAQLACRPAPALLFTTAPGPAPPLTAYACLPTLQVDKSMGLIEGVHSKNLATFNGAKEQCYSYVEGTVNQAKALLDPTPYIQWTSDKVAVYANPDKIVDTSFQILDPVAGKVATLGKRTDQNCFSAGGHITPAQDERTPSLLPSFCPAVPEPVIKTGLKTYGTVHDTVVVSLLALC